MSRDTMKNRPPIFRSAALVVAAFTIVTISPPGAFASTDRPTGLGGNEPTTAAVNPLSPNIVAVARGLTVAISTDFGVTFPTTVRRSDDSAGVRHDRVMECLR